MAREEEVRVDVGLVDCITEVGVEFIEGLVAALLVLLVESPKENEKAGAVVEAAGVALVLCGVPKLKDGAVLADLLKVNIELGGSCNCDVVELPKIEDIDAAGVSLAPKLKSCVFWIAFPVTDAVTPFIVLDRLIAHIAALLTRFNCTNGTFLSPP